MRLSIVLSLVSCALAASASSASADIWVETGPSFGNPPQADAGNLIGGPNVNLTAGVGSLTGINGNMLNGSDTDLYCIRITDPAAFSAQTLSGSPTGNLSLALFSATGTGIVANYDLSAANINARITGASVPGPGIYYLLVFGLAQYPTDTDVNFIFPPALTSSGATGEILPSAGVGTLTGYGFDFTAGFPPFTPFSYSVNLTGAEFHQQIPTPAAGVLGSLLGLAALRRRR